MVMLANAEQELLPAFQQIFYINFPCNAMDLTSFRRCQNVSKQKMRCPKLKTAGANKLVLFY